jgi:hypothetical protein
MLPISKGKIGSVSEIIYGQFKGLTIKSTDSVNINVYVDDKLTKTIDLCSYQDNYTISVQSDEYSNETLIACIIHYIFEMYKDYPKLYLIHYGASLCTDNNIGMNLMEYAKYGNLESFVKTEYTRSKYCLVYSTINKEQVTRFTGIKLQPLISILKQCTLGLKLLIDTFDFRSGDLKAANILISDEHIKTNIYGLNIDSDFTCKIGDYGKSSITVKVGNHNYRLFSYNPYASLANIFDSTNVASNGYYMIDSRLITLSKARHSSHPYYQSFDFYTLLVSLLSIQEYHNIFFADHRLVDMWNELFIEPIIIKSRLLRETRSINDAISILSGVKLRCDAIDLVIYHLSKM